MIPNYQDRRNLLTSNLAPGQAYLISQPSHIQYLSGYQFIIPSQEREAFLILHPHLSALVYSSFSPLPDQKFLTDIKLFTKVSPYFLAQHLRSLKNSLPDLEEILINFDDITVSYQQSLLEAQLKPISFDPFSTIWPLRIKKDTYELSRLKEAGRIANQAWEKAKKKIALGMTEKQIANMIDQEMFFLGADSTAFPTIVAFGKNAALPHHQPTNQILLPDTPILADFGARIDGYCSDMSRSFWFGENIDPEYKNVLEQVHLAYDLSVSTLRNAFEQGKIALHSAQNGSIAKDKLKYQDLDLVARKQLATAGLDKFFIHTIGHGLGLDIHESPSVSSSNQDLVAFNTALTIEPGVYIEGKFGVRYENTLFVGEDEILVLT